MTPKAVNLRDKLAGISQPWSPKIIADMDGFQFKLARLAGEFVWHSHADTDEAFLVLEGQLRIEFRDGEIDLAQGELVVVPRGIEHRPVTETECSVLLFERQGTVNTGDARTSELTADPNARI